ncbi:MAG TPA: hypothetical protein VK977_09435 [Actinomycetota bacterium]|nr:hypothetical protein [Actinomycetota bacterium]
MIPFKDPIVQPGHGPGFLNAEFTELIDSAGERVSCDVFPDPRGDGEVDPPFNGQPEEILYDLLVVLILPVFEEKAGVQGQCVHVPLQPTWCLSP